jgi:hypothetical protein
VFFRGVREKCAANCWFFDGEFVVIGWKNVAVSSMFFAA